MSKLFGIRFQAAAVIVLFLGSLSTVLISAVQALHLPQAEREVQDRLREASRHMADAAAGQLDTADGLTGRNFDRLNAALRQITDRQLRRFQGVEGGFFLSDGARRFAGYAFPTGAEAEQAPTADADRPNSAGAAPVVHVRRSDDPPPREMEFVVAQAQHSLTLAPDESPFDFDVRTVGTSRVAIFTEPVGSQRPARAATWVMFRLTRPEDLAAKVVRYEVSTGLALGGIGLAAVLTLNLGRTLRTQRREKERLGREQARLRDELRRAEHLAALGKLLAGVAHEVRNPLAAIRSTVQLWERLPEIARNPSSTAAVIHAVDRLNDIVTRLLYFSRTDSAERRPVQINDLLSETLELLTAQATTQGVSIAREFDQALPAVGTAASALQQVFLNLASNALQAMPRGGHLRCVTRYNTAAHKVEIRFEDSGPGIAAEDQKHVFEPFFTTRADGTGLGLSLCHEILLQHGGAIQLAASSASGSTFVVLLPAREADGKSALRN